MNKNILFFGDSLTAGYGLQDAANQSFPALIQHKIKAAGLLYQVINAGISGDTSAGGLARIEYWLSRPIDVFVLELGINDIWRGVTPSATMKNLQSIITKVNIRYPNARLALMGMQLPVAVPGNFTAEFRSIFGKLAQKNNMAFVPFFLEGVVGNPKLNLGDGVHPSAEGYKVIANKVWPVLEPLLRTDHVSINKAS